MNNLAPLVISHCLSKIQHACEIAKQGTHNSLITQDAFYKKLMNMQKLR